MAEKKKRRTKQVKMWGGFCGGRLAATLEYDFPQSGNAPEIPSVYRSRKIARKYFQDVRPVTLVYQQGN